MSKKAQNILTISRCINNEIIDTNHRKIICSSSEKDTFISWTEERNTKLFNIKDIHISRHHSSFENDLWTKFKRLFVTSILIRIKTFKIITFSRTSQWINKISYTIHRILCAINSEIIISRTLNAAKINYSRDENAAIINKIVSSTINKTIISRVINNEKFLEIIIFIFISIKNSANFWNIAKFLQQSIILIRKFLHLSIKKEVNAQTIILISFFKILLIISIIEAIL